MLAVNTYKVQYATSFRIHAYVKEYSILKNNSYNFTTKTMQTNESIVIKSGGTGKKTKQNIEIATSFSGISWYP